MMFPLVLDIRNHLWDLGLTDGESTIALLPFEKLQFGKFFVYPL
jgi:hypothetical protein